MQNSEKQICVIGAGISGLAAATYLKSLGKDVVIFESLDFPGGRMRTLNIKDKFIPLGAEFITPSYKNLWSEVNKYRLEMRPINEGRFGIIKNGEIAYLQTDNLWKLITFPGISTKAKLRLLAFAPYYIYRLLIADSQDLKHISKYDNSSILDMQKNLGKETMDYVIDPIIRATFHYEKGASEMSFAYGLAWLKNVAANKRDTAKNGIQSIPQKMSENIKVIYNQKVSKVKRTKEGKVEVLLSSNEIKLFDRVIIAIPGNLLSQIIEDPYGYEKEFFSEIKYSKLLKVLCSIDISELPNLDVSAIPMSENKYVESLSIHDIGEKEVIFSMNLRSEFSKKFPEIKTNEQIAKKILEIYPLELEPKVHLIHKWEAALPKFYKGYVSKINEFESEYSKNKDKSISYCGDFLGGPYLEGAYISGIKAAMNAVL